MLLRAKALNPTEQLNELVAFTFIYVYVDVCVIMHGCTCIYTLCIYIYIYTHRHTDIHTYIHMCQKAMQAAGASGIP